MAGQPDAETVSLSEINEQLERFKARLHTAIASHDGSVEADEAIAVLQRQLWNQQALSELADKRVVEAAKASREAVRQGELAVKLAKSTIADRVAALERAVAEGKRKGRGVAAAAKRRRKA